MEINRKHALTLNTVAYSELLQASKMELFAKIVNGFNLLINLPNSSILGVCGDLNTPV